MKFISIVPSAHMKDALKTSYTTLVLSNLIKEGNEYQQACLNFKKARGKIIMDNGFYEKMQNPPVYELVEKAKLINADILVLPDLKMNSELRSQSIKNINLVRKNGFNGKLMQCVYAQNSNWEEDVMNFKILNSIDCLDIIAIPYHFGTRKKDEWKRTILLDLIEKKVNSRNINHRIHLFGCNNFHMLKRENRWWIDSIDGTMPWKCGYYLKQLPILTIDEPARPKNYFQIKNITKAQRNCIYQNMIQIKKECERRVKNES